MKDPVHTSPSEEKNGGDLYGPLSRVIETTAVEGDLMERMGNIFIFAFAGHDTTGHTLTWLTLELAKRPDLQSRLQAEIDDLFQRLNGRPLVYQDLHDLKFMT